MINNDEKLLSKIMHSDIIEYGHFILRSKKHSGWYIKKTKLTSNPEMYSEIIHKLTDKIQYYYCKRQYDIITGPAVAGICFASPVAFLLEKSLIFPEKEKINNEDYIMEFRPEYQEKLWPKTGHNRKQVIIIEDIITTGESVKKVAESICKYGGTPIGIFCIWNRNPDLTHLVYKDINNHNNNNFSLFIRKNEFDIPIHSHSKLPIFSLISHKIPDYDEKDCPICNM